jgi:hypothetical protein
LLLVAAFGRRRLFLLLFIFVVIELAVFVLSKTSSSYQPK